MIHESSFNTPDNKYNYFVKKLTALSANTDVKSFSLISSQNLPPFNSHLFPFLPPHVCWFSQTYTLFFPNCLWFQGPTLPSPSLPFIFFYFTILYWFCHTSIWICHGCTHAPHPEPHSHLPPHTIPLGYPSAPAPSFLYPASNLDWWFLSYMILYMFQCHSPKSSHPLPLPQSPKDCSIHQCLFCCLTYRVIITIFLNSIYMH